MNEAQFHSEAEAILAAIETAVDAIDVDIGCTRVGNVLTLELDDGSRVIINSQLPTRQIWAAARSGGFHYELRDDRWFDTKDGEELFASLSRILSQQAGKPVLLSAPR